MAFYKAAVNFFFFFNSCLVSAIYTVTKLYLNVKLSSHAFTRQVRYSITVITQSHNDWSHNDWSLCHSSKLTCDICCVLTSPQWSSVQQGIHYRLIMFIINANIQSISSRYRFDYKYVWHDHLVRTYASSLFFILFCLCWISFYLHFDETKQISGVLSKKTFKSNTEKWFLCG